MVEKVARKIHELGEQGVQFATFPETVVPYYPYFSFIQDPYQVIAGREHRRLLEQAVTVPSAATDAISEACRQAGVVVSIGVNERDHGTLYNAAQISAEGARGASNLRGNTKVRVAHVLGMTTGALPDLKEARHEIYGK
jgi:predicted amidohydrolase